MIFAIGVALAWAGCVTPAYVREEAPASAVLAEQRVSWETFDADLLSAAVFAETNQVRRRFGLKRLRTLPRLRGAAEVQAFTNALTGVASHANPLAGRASAWDRVRRQGLLPTMVLENVAITLVRQPESGGAVRIVVADDGARTRRDDLTGEQLPWPTYAELAQRIVQQWMDSPPHRVNVLHPEVRYLACGTELARSPLGGEIVHAIQVFMAKSERR